MSSTMDTLEPPSTVKRELKNPLSLLIQIFGLMIQFWISYFKAGLQYFIPLEEKNIKDQVVLITGAGRGLGREMAIEFAKRGCKVACAEIQSDLNKETVELVNGIRPKGAKGYYCDVADPESVANLRKEVLADFGKVDIIVNNAAIIAGGSLLNKAIEPKIYEGVVKVNFTSHFWMLKEFLPEIVARNSGHIVCIASMSAFTGLANGTLYTSCKWAVTGLYESLREELRSKNKNNKVQVTVACPYFINTSAKYVNSWECRFPELSVQNAAQEIIKGICENQFIFSIPRNQYFAANFMKLVPQDVKDKFSDIFFSRVKEVKKEDVDNLPTYKIATGTYQKK